ncbi:transcriptional regulator, TetR family [Flavobacteriaceae bacterium MAR_2010_188]|nr:transcriptional regulator, TetR family [Flavobacteriaceae bacterium MAR_2010_188]
MQDNRKSQIINTASKLFKERGYSAVTMRDLATELGIKAASLYNHINSKQEILKEIIISIAEDFTEGIKEIEENNLSASDKLRAIVKLHVIITSENPYGMASLNNDWMHLEDKLEYYLELRNKYEERFRKILKQGIERNEFMDLDVEVMLFSVLSTLRSLYLWIPKKENLNIPTLASDLSLVLIEGINK